MANLSVLAEDLDGAIEYLEVAFEGPEAMIMQMGIEPLWDPLRSDPRFQDLVRRIGIPTG